MRYRLASADPTRAILTLRMPERPFVIAFLAVAALVCLLVGLAFAIADGPAASPGDGLRAVCFIGFGLSCLCAIFLFSTGIVFPKRLTFDNPTGWLTVQDARGETEGAVPYDGIAGFSVCRATANGIVRHSVGIDLSRGGRWELYASRSAGRAGAFVDRLSSLVSLPVKPTGTPPASAVFPGTASAGGSILFEWKRQTRPAAMVVSILAVACFAASLATIRPFTDGAVGSAVAAGFSLLLVGAVVIGLARTAGERTVIEVGRGSVRVRRTSMLTRERVFTAPIADIAAIDLSLTFNGPQTAISLLRATEVEPFTRYRQGAFGPGEVPDIIRFLRGLRRIDVSGLPPGRRLALAEALREAVAGRG
jgi:hypothetical protein